MLHATQAPDFAANGTYQVNVIKGFAYPKGRHGDEKAKFPVLTVERFGKPYLFIDESGNGRLVRPREGRSGYSTSMTYVNDKVFRLDNPFDQPVRAVVKLYEEALETL